LAHAPQWATLVFTFTHAPAQSVNPVLQAMPHAPAVHVGCPEGGTGQALVHEPQRFGSSSRTHWPAQSPYPELQATPHVPLVQTAAPFAGAAQEFPHAPQCTTFALGSTHAPAQDKVPGGHASMQSPPEQASVAPQRTPHPPQLPGSICAWTQAFPHRAKPGRQVKSQAPAWHRGTPNDGAVQALPQPPQCSGSVAVVLHAPAQSAAPAAHAGLHAPATHVELPSSGGVQETSQPPQWARSEARVTQAPAHSACPAGQSSTHWLLAQTLPVAHVAPHFPQFFGSLLVSTHASPQAVKPSRHVCAHSPAAQFADAFWFGTQARPQAPQLAPSAARSTHASPQRTSSSAHTKSQDPEAHTGSPPVGAVHSTPQPPHLEGSSATSTHSAPHSR
jgi:hypothetical protein